MRRVKALAASLRSGHVDDLPSSKSSRPRSSVHAARLECSTRPSERSRCSVSAIGHAKAVQSHRRSPRHERAWLARPRRKHESNFRGRRRLDAQQARPARRAARSAARAGRRQTGAFSGAPAAAGNVGARGPRVKARTPSAKRLAVVCGRDRCGSTIVRRPSTGSSLRQFRLSSE